MTRASVLLGAGGLAMATGLMGAAAPAIELAVEGGVYRVFTQGVDRPQALRVRIENQANRPLAGIVAVTLLAGGPECSAPFAAPAGGQGTSTSPGPRPEPRKGRCTPGRRPAASPRRSPPGAGSPGSRSAPAVPAAGLPLG